jgi:cytochrome b561
MATIRNERYTNGAIALHWIVFALVVIVGTLGLLHDSWPKKTKAFWINIHVLIGIVLWLTLIIRAVYRYRHRPPELPVGIDTLSRRLANPVHLALYALIFVIPLIGMVTFVYHGRALDLGFVQVHFGIQKDRAIFEPTEDIHGYLAYGLFGLAGLHALAALWHRFIRKDGVFQRMWPGRNVSRSEIRRT